MSERANLVSLFREVDRSVVAFGDEVAEDVGIVLEPYRSGAAGWFERYRSSVDATFHEGLLPVVDALQEMRRRSLEEMEPGRRVIASGALARANPQTFLPPPDGGQTDESTLLVRVLVPVMHPDNQNDEKGFELLRLLGGKTADGIDDPALKYDWEATLALAVQLQLLEASVARDAAVCCQASWTSVDVAGEVWPASVLHTTFSTAEIDLDELRDYLSPENWPDCCSLWCSMDRLNHGLSPSCYLEHISFTCPGPWRLRTCLEFVRTDLDQGISLEYQLCQDPIHRPQSDQVVRVDEGSIVGIQNGSQVCITSTKRVSFRGPFDAPSFAMWACVLGYGEAAREMAFRCARDKTHPSRQPWQADQPANRPSAGGEMSASGGPAVSVDHLAEVAAEGVRSSAQACKDFVTTLSTQGTSPDEIVNAAAAMWTEPARAMLRLCSPVPPASSAPDRVTSEPFFASVQVAPETRRIVLSAPLVSGFGHRIEVAALSAEPALLQPGQNEFRIAANVTGRPAGVYRGSVRVVGDQYPGTLSGGAPVQVWLQVS